ncbi:hypothetical protein [Streptococcus sobrinus]|uniref:Uncharacterized protein n=1 Tax=Streptococcus sobrinus W1703 TaxID=1227275 RepID=U2IPV7_9STRE|nr:hypothetical protein [Streptococcus sobrinus]ERJ75946.1 hypothetical protein HMPREF1557_01276 [Streptococcus sobrinus W1703]
MRKTSDYKWAVILSGLIPAIGIIVGVFYNLGFDRPLPYLVALAVIVGVSLGLWGLRWQLKKDKEDNRA